MRESWALKGMGGCALAATLVGLSLALARPARLPQLAAPRPPVAVRRAVEDSTVLRVAVATPLQTLDEPWQVKSLQEQQVPAVARFLDSAPVRLSGGPGAVPEPGLGALLGCAALAHFGSRRLWRRPRR